MLDPPGVKGGVTVSWTGPGGARALMAAGGALEGLQPLLPGVPDLDRWQELRWEGLRMAVSRECAGLGLHVDEALSGELPDGRRALVLPVTTAMTVWAVEGGPGPREDVVYEIWASHERLETYPDARPLAHQDTVELWRIDVAARDGTPLQWGPDRYGTRLAVVGKWDNDWRSETERLWAVYEAMPEGSPERTAFQAGWGIGTGHLDRKSLSRGTAEAYDLGRRHAHVAQGLPERPQWRLAAEILADAIPVRYGPRDGELLTAPQLPVMAWRLAATMKDRLAVGEARGVGEIGAGEVRSWEAAVRADRLDGEDEYQMARLQAAAALEDGRSPEWGTDASQWGSPGEGFQPDPRAKGSDPSI